jgi:hypothetical protein
MTYSISEKGNSIDTLVIIEADMSLSVAASQDRVYLWDGGDDYDDSGDDYDDSGDDYDDSGDDYSNNAYITLIIHTNINIYTNTCINIHIYTNTCINIYLYIHTLNFTFDYRIRGWGHDSKHNIH